MENRLMTIVFIDMQGYTKRSATQTIEEMKLFHDQMFKFVSDLVERRGGVMVKTMGDGFMIRFDSPTNAVQTGIEIQRRLESRNAQMMNPDSIVRFRIGINTGEVGIDENGDLFGDPVNIASRIQTFADTNDVFISEATYLAMNRNEFGAVDLGAQELKNATREIKIYKVLKNGSPGVTLPGARKPEAAASAPVMADSHKKLLVGAVVGGLILFTLVAGYIIGVRRSRQSLPPSNPVVTQNPQQPVLPMPSVQPSSAQPARPTPSEPVSASAGVKSGGNTLLTVDPALIPANLSDFDRKIIGDIQALFQNGQHNRAEVKCGEAVYRSGDQQKPIFALLLAEIFWMQNKKKEAGQIFRNLNELKIPGSGRQKLKRAIDNIKRRTAG